MRLVAFAEHALGLRGDPREPQRLVGFLNGQPLVRGLAARERALRHHEREDFVLAVAVARKLRERGRPSAVRRRHKGIRGCVIGQPGRVIGGAFQRSAGHVPFAIIY
jgi:hypothetical protein